MLCCVVVWCGVVCGVVWCGVVWCGVVCMFVSFCVVFMFFSQFSSFSFLLSLFLSSLFFPLFSLLFLFFFSLLFLFFFSLHFSPRRPTSRHWNVIWRTASAQQSVLSLLPPLLKKKEEGTFHYRNIFGEGIIFYNSFISIQKNRRRVKLQALQFYINSNTIDLQRVKTVIILRKMVETSDAPAPA